MVSGLVTCFQLKNAVLVAADAFPGRTVPPAQPEVFFPLQFHLTSGGFLGVLSVGSVWVGGGDIGTGPSPNLDFLSVGPGAVQKRNPRRWTEVGVRVQ